MGRKIFGWGGIGASVVLVTAGVVAIVLGVLGRAEVRDSLAEQNIVAGGDAAEITGGKLREGELVNTGAEAKQFASVMESHTLDATGGRYYAEMGRFLTAGGEETNDAAAAAVGANGRPVENGLRQMWVTETALATALNMAFFGERVASFSILMGVALLLTGVGFLVLTVGGALGAVPGRARAARRPEVAPG